MLHVTLQRGYNHNLHPRLKLLNLWVVLHQQVITVGQKKTLWIRRYGGTDAMSSQKYFFFSLSFENAENIINAFVTSKLDHCNSLLSGCANSSLRTLQLCKTLLHVHSLETGRTQHISPVPASLHWFPVSSCLEFKIQLIAYKERSVRSDRTRATVWFFAAGVRCLSKPRVEVSGEPLRMRRHFWWGSFAQKKASFWRDHPVDRIPFFSPICKILCFVFASQQR